MNTPKSSTTERELKFYEASIKALSALIIIYFIISILLNKFYGISVVLGHSGLVSGILGGLIGIGLFIQIRRYVLYKRIGKGKDFLLSRSFILLLVVFLALIYILFF